VFGFLEGIGCANSKERKKEREGIWVLFLGKRRRREIWELLRRGWGETEEGRTIERVGGVGVCRTY
jgi:hypothetical protein